MTSDACNVDVLAGPTEATVMGNIAVVYSALGELENLCDIRRAVTNSTEIKTYKPQNNADWEKAYADYIAVIKKQ